MIRERAAQSPIRRTARLPALAALAVVVVVAGCGGLLGPGANAATLPRDAGMTLGGSDHGGANGAVWVRGGNGRLNKSSIAINSPTFSRGIQHITNTTVDGSTNSQASFCRRKFRHCRIHQKIVVFDP